MVSVWLTVASDRNFRRCAYTILRRVQVCKRSWNSSSFQNKAALNLCQEWRGVHAITVGSAKTTPACDKDPDSVFSDIHCQVKRKRKTGNPKNFTHCLDGRNEKVDCHIASRFCLRLRCTQWYSLSSLSRTWNNLRVSVDEYYSQSPMRDRGTWVLLLPPGGSSAGKWKLFTKEITYDCDDGDDYSDNRHRLIYWSPFFLRRGVSWYLSSLFTELFNLLPHKIVRMGHTLIPFSREILLPVWQQ